MKISPELKKKLARDELWRRGILTWKFHAGQKVINDAYNKITNQLFLCNVARQFGKSYWAVCKAIECALSKPKAQVRYGAAFYSDLKDFIIPNFDAVLEDCPEDIKPTWYPSYSSYIFPNGSRIKLVGCDRKPEGLRGPALDGIYLDEAAFIKNLDFIYKSILIPTTTKRPNCKIVIISTPPTSPDSDFKMYVEKAEKEKAYVKLDIYKNPTLNQETIDRLIRESGGEDSTTWLREYMCELITDENSKIIPEWKESKEFEEKYIRDLPKDEYYHFYHKYDCMDLGFVDYTALIFGYYNFRLAVFHVEDELQAKGPTANTNTLNAQIRAKENQLWGEQPPYRRIADNNNPQYLNEFTINHNLVFLPTGKTDLETMVNTVKDWVIRGRLIISPKCTNLIACLKYGTWDNKRKQFSRSKDYGHYDHLAALIYLIRNIDVITNPIPPTYGFVPHTTWNYNKAEQLNNNTLNKHLIPKFKQP